MNGTSRNRSVAKTTTKNRIVSSRSLVCGSLILKDPNDDMSSCSSSSSSFTKPNIITTMKEESPTASSSVLTASTRSLSTTSSSSLSKRQSVLVSTSSESSSLSSSGLVEDYQLLEAAEEAYANEKVFHAVRLLEQVQDKSLYTEQHQKIIDIATFCNTEVKDILFNDFTKQEDNVTSNDTTTNGWIKQSESNNGKYDMTLYYKFSEENASALTYRLESAIPFRLLIPLLCVFNEVELFPTWCPKGFRNTGLKHAQQLRTTSRINQIAYLYRTAPWPFSPREVIVQSIAIDETNAPDDNYVGFILHNIDPIQQNVEIPTEGRAPDTVATDVTGTFLFRPCPSDHPLATAYYQKHNVTNDQKEPMLLVTFKIFGDTHMKGIPKGLVNYAMKIFTPKVWSILMELSEQIEKGERPLHKQAIDTKPEIYNFMKERVQVLFDRMNNNNNNSMDNEQPPVPQTIVHNHEPAPPEQAPTKKQGLKLFQFKK